jgi:hypothetical protein
MRFLLSFLFLTASIYSFSQGCSDAGVCSATQQFDVPEHNKISHHFSMTPSIGLGDQQSLVIGSAFSYQLQTQKGWAVGVALPYSITTGNLGTTSGIGDFILSLNIPVIKSEKHQLSWLVAGKIASGDANKKIDDAALPMVYQQSSGTNDIITSLNWNINSWLFAIGYQHAFNTTENQFYAPDFPIDSDAFEYHSSSYLKRGDDIMLRAEKRFQGKGKASYRVGALPIYRIQSDEIKVDGDYEDIPNSTGLTLNLYASWKYQFTDQFYSELQLAAPPVTREVRADGTTRSFLINFRLGFVL